MPKIVLSIGVDRYDDKIYNDLVQAVADANDFGGFLKYKLGFELVSMNSPTAWAAEAKLEEILGVLDDDSTFVFYFAGHGVRYERSADPLLLCRDAAPGIVRGTSTTGGIAPAVFADFARRAKGDCAFIYDACRTEPTQTKTTGGFGSVERFRDVSATRPTSNGDRIGARWSLASCADGQLATDDGAFEKALIAEMTVGLGSPSGLIFNDDFVSRLRKRLETATGQRPSSKGDPLRLSDGTGENAESEIERLRREIERLTQLVENSSDKKPTAEPPGAARGGNSAGERREIEIKGAKYAFRWSPPGRFLMGSPKNQRGSIATRWIYDNESQHNIVLKHGVWVLETPVTQSLWEAIMKENPSRFKGANLPVESVSWNDCQTFIQKVNDLKIVSDEEQFRLPTEAEWEYACRAGTTGPYNGTNLSELGWHSGNSDGRTHLVGQKKANAWGLLDMHGNVWEWCSDWYGEYRNAAVEPPAIPTNASARVMRGGSWNSDARYCRSAYRNFNKPSSRLDFVSFRLVLSSFEY